MHFRTTFYIGLLMGLALCFSCKEKEEPVPPYKDTVYPAQDLLYLSQVLPELEEFPSIQYNDELGYYIPLGTKEWSRSLTVDPVSIPAQSCSFSVDALRYEADDFSGWEVSDTWDIVLEDIPANLSWGQCPSTFRMTLSLGDSSPYRKVTVSDMIITFPSGFTARADYRNDIPLVSRVDAVASSGDRKAAFSAEGNDVNYMFLAYLASNHHEGYFNVHVPALSTLIESPFPGGTVQPSLLLQPVFKTSGFVVPGQEYSMHIKAEMVLPLAFDGPINVGSFTTPSVLMDGVTLGARAHYKQKFALTVGSGLPFDCRVTPVFTMEGEAPRYLDEFFLDKKNRSAELSLVFAPTKDDWAASIHFIVTPLRGWNEPIFNCYRMDVMKFLFSANLPET